MDEELRRYDQYMDQVLGPVFADGSSLKEVADVLLHRSLNTTLIYAKLDSGRLVEVALTWSGASAAAATTGRPS